MALRYSTGARNFMAGYGSLAEALRNGVIKIYTGAQPASANDAATGTLLCTITVASGAHTAEVLPSGSITFAGTAGSIDSVTVGGVDILGGAVAYTTDLATTVAAVAKQINRKKIRRIKASASAGVLTLTALAGGSAVTLHNAVVGSTQTTITATPANFGAYTAPVNGLEFDEPAGNVVAKLASQTWSGVNAATGTAGYYRFYGSAADDGTLDSAGVRIREDGAIGTTGSELNMSSTSLANAATTTISAWDRTLPTA